jgi:hypothetical protein
MTPKPDRPSLSTTITKLNSHPPNHNPLLTSPPIPNPQIHPPQPPQLPSSIRSHPSHAGCVLESFEDGWFSRSILGLRWYLDSVDVRSWSIPHVIPHRRSESIIWNNISLCSDSRSDQDKQCHREDDDDAIKPKLYEHREFRTPRFSSSEPAWTDENTIENMLILLRLTTWPKTAFEILNNTINSWITKAPLRHCHRGWPGLN